MNQVKIDLSLNVNKIEVPEDFEKFLLPTRQVICGPSQSGIHSCS